MIKILHLTLTALVLIAAVQDYRTREVSNWITVPVFLGGLAAALYWMFVHGYIVPLAAIALMAAAWNNGRLGGADAKTLAGLWGLWPLAAWISMLVLAFWAGVLLAKRGSGKFAAMLPVSIGVLLTIFYEFSIMQGV